MSVNFSDSNSDRKAFGQLFRRENAMLVRFLTGLTSCRSAAEDLAQTAWLKLLNARDRGMCGDQPPHELRAYLFQVARNAFIDEHTRKHAGARTFAQDPAQLAEIVSRTCFMPSVEEQAVTLETQALVKDAVAALPEEQREVVRMWCDGECARQFARRRRLSYDTLQSRRKRALARLRSSLESRHLALG